MLIKYKTILRGDKPIEWGTEKRLEPNEPVKYEIIKYKFCCKKMEDYINNNGGFYFSHSTFPEPILNTYIPDGYGEVFDEQINFCPFCGKKIKYKEVKKFRLRGIKKEIEEYIEEEIK